MVVNSKDSVRGARGEPGQRRGLVALHVDLHEVRQAVLRDQRIQRRDRQADLGIPALALPARCAVGGGDEVGAGGGDGGVGGVEAQHRLARHGADQRRDARHAGIAAEEQAQQAREARLRLDRHHAGADAAEARRAVADMRADVEGEIARA